MQAAGHQKVARAFRRRGRDDRSLILAEISVPHPFADRRNDIRAQLHVVLHRLSAQVEEAVPKACFFRILLVPKDHQGQFARWSKHLKIAHEDLDLTRRQFGVHKAFVARLHNAVDPDAPFRAHLFDFGKNRAVGVGQNLRHAIVVAQIDEQHATVVPDPVDPARKANGFAHVFSGQRGAGMAAIGVHGQVLFGAHLGVA